MREGGDGAAADRAASLKRPTIPVWAINQLAREQPAAIKDLIETHRSLARVKGAGKLQDLSRHRKRLLRALTEQARELLIDGGHSPSAQTIERITSTLLAANTPEEENLLRKGRLQRELTPSGFQEAFTDLPTLEAASDSSSTEAKKRAEKKVQDLATEARAAKDKAKALARDAARMRREADAADEEAKALTRRADQLEKKLKAARDKAGRK